MYYKKFLTFIYFRLINKARVSLLSLKLIKLRLSQEILLLLLKPQWLLQLEKSFLIKAKKQYVAIISNHISKILIKSPKYQKISKITLNVSFDLKNIQLKKIFGKISFDTTLKKCLYNYLVKLNYLQSTFASTYDFLYFSPLNEIPKLCKIIYFHGLEWFIYTNYLYKSLYLNLCLIHKDSKLIVVTNNSIVNRLVKDICIFINLQSCSLKKFHCDFCQYSRKSLQINIVKIQKNIHNTYFVKPGKNFLRSILKTIRSRLYCKNKDGNWRVRNDISINKAVFFSNFLLRRWYRYYFSIIGDIDILEANKLADNLLYSWQVKR